MKNKNENNQNYDYKLKNNFKINAKESWDNTIKTKKLISLYFIYIKE